MNFDRSRRATWSVRAASLLIGSVVIIGACGGSETTLQGIVRDEPLIVGSVAVTDVTSAGRYAANDGSFEFRAEPGRLLVVYFGYTNCPDLCPTTLALVRAAKRELGDDGDRIDLAMVTVDANRDTPEVMNGFLASFTDAFHALVPADESELRAAEEAFLASSSILTDASGEIEVGHSATAYVVDSTGTVLVEWPFGIDKNVMIDDLRILLESA
ncbi:MAG: SCO family protein [Actinomycetota bacterium]